MNRIAALLSGCSALAYCGATVLPLIVGCADELRSFLRIADKIPLAGLGARRHRGASMPARGTAADT